jgi:hypothetical protein
MQTAVSERSRGISLILAGMLGWVGGHRYYNGKIATGVAQALTLGGFGFWWLYDIVLIAFGGFRDAEDRRVIRWWEGSEIPAGLTRPSDTQLELILEELDALRDDVGDLGERLEFMERVLPQVKDRLALLPPESG